MAHAITLKGVTGSLRYGYLSAATLSAWTLRPLPDGASLRATVSESNTFRLTQRPLTFTAPFQGRALSWPVRTLQVSGALLTATLGSLER